MKNSKLLFCSLILFSLFIFSKCSPDQALTPSTNEVLTHNNWSVDYFYETQDLTSDYGGYNILFSSTGTVAAQKANESITGTWSNITDADNNEAININLNTNDPELVKLNQSWKLVGQTASTLQFEEDTHVNTTTLLRIKKQ